MNKKTEQEDFMPELSAVERASALEDMQSKSPWGKLHANAPARAKQRIEIAYLINCFAGKRNMWPIREERTRVESTLTISDLEYLIRSRPSETGKEHYRQLLYRVRARPHRTDKKFSKLVSNLPEDERDLVCRTMDAVLDQQDPVMLTRDSVWEAVGGSADAQALLGDSFLHEHEVLRDVEIAAYWLRKAAPFNKTAKTQLAELQMDESGAKETAYGEFLVNQEELAAATGISKRTIRYYCSEGKGAEMTSRDKIFALAVAMKLSVNCTEALLAACDYRFTNSSRDTVIRDYIQRRQGTVDGLNYLLSDMKLGKLQVKDEKL